MAGCAAAIAAPARPVSQLLTGAILLTAFLVQVPYVLNPDLAWLLTVAERVIQGQRLGIDVIELNPPASVLLYMPAAFLGLHTPVRPEYWVIVLTLAAAAGAVRLSVWILAPLLKAPGAHSRAALLLLALLALAPLRNFGEREHIAVIGLLPFVAMAARRGAGHAPSPVQAVLAGLAGGLAMCLKPHFAAVAGLPLLWNAATRRSIAPLFGTESRYAAGVVIGYLAAALLVFPQYFTKYPAIIALTYLPYREHLPYLLTAGLSAFAVLVLASQYVARLSVDEQWRGAGPWLAAMLGGVFSFLAQGKDFGYVRLPMVLFALAALALAPSVVQPRAWREMPWTRRAAILVLAALLMLQPTAGENRSDEFIGPLRQLAPPRPAMLVISDASEIGQPLTRKLDGRWVSGTGSQIMTAGAMEQLEIGRLDPAQKALATSIVDEARQRLRADLTQRPPDVLMIDSERFHTSFDWLGWMRADPVVAETLDRQYRLATTVGGVAIWLRLPGSRSAFRPITGEQPSTPASPLPQRR